MPAQTPYFQGDAPELVDALIEACQRKPVANPALEGLIGRALEPFAHFDDTLPTAPTAKMGTKHAAPSSSSTSPTARSPARNKRSKARQSLDTPASASAASRSAARRSPAPSCSGSFVSAGRALGCPAFFTSPKPTALPLPSTGLLQKALPTGPSPTESCNAAAAAAATAAGMFMATGCALRTAAA